MLKGNEGKIYISVIKPYDALAQRMTSHKNNTLCMIQKLYTQSALAEYFPRIWHMLASKCEIVSVWAHRILHESDIKG